MNLLISLKYLNLFFPVSYQEEFQPVKYYVSRISTSRNVKLKIVKFSFLASSAFFFLNFALKTYGTLKMFLNNFYIISSSYVEEHVKKDSSLNFVFGRIPGFQNLDVFLKTYCRASFEILFRQK